MKKLDFRTLVMLLCVASMTVFFSCDNDNEPVSDYNGHTYVDLGLSVKWATCNVGADSPEEYGDYFAWGETKPKLFYTREEEENNTYTDNPEALSSIRDAASVNMGGSWRMPTLKELKELVDKCTWTWTTLNGVEGYEVKSKKNSNAIFLPAAGYRDGSGLGDAGSYGYYWSSSLTADYSSHAYSLYFNSVGVNWSSYYRYYGRSVRGVCP